MTFEATLIAPYKSGLSKYYKPFLIGNDAFVELDNCYSQRGFIRKREGSVVLSRTDAWKAATAITNATPPQVTANAHGLLTGDMVYLENVVMNNGAVSNVTTGNQTIVTVAGAPGVVAFQSVILSGVVGVTQTNGSDINGKPWIVASVGANSITLNVSSSGAYIAGGTVLLGALEKTAFYITKIDANNFTLQILNSQLSPPANQPASGLASSASIYLPIVGTRNFIFNTTGQEQLIVFNPKRAYLYNTGTGTLDNISFNNAATPILWAGTKDNFFYSSNYASVMWATNNICNTTDQPVGIRYYNGSSANGWTDFQPLISGTAPDPQSYLNSALMVIPYKGRLVALNTTEGTNAGPPAQNNKNFYNRARWCQLGTSFLNNPPANYGTDPNAWRDDIPGKGGYIDADTNDRIVSCGIIQDTLIVFFQFSTWRLRWTSDPTLPFIWERINTSLGSEATFSTVTFDTDAVSISRRGIAASTFNDVDRIDLAIPDAVNDIETGQLVEGLNRVHGVRDFQKRMVYWIYGDQNGNNQTPNKLLCYNYQDKTWSTFTQSFTTLGNYHKISDNTWSTWTSPWNGDTTQWNTPLEQSNTITIVAGDVTGRVWTIMNDDVSTDNGVNYNFSITTNVINPYFQSGMRCKLAYYDLYIENTDNGQVIVKHFIDDDSDDPVLIKTVDTNDNAIEANPSKAVKYIRVFLGTTARNHQITITMSADQLADPLIGGSDFQMQGVVMHFKQQGRIKK